MAFVMRHAWRFSLMGAAFVSAACSGSYEPARSPRVSVVMEGGSFTLVRDGERYPVGFFGTGVVDAVRGNAEAEEHARAYRNLTIAGWSTYGVGLGAAIGGGVLLANNQGGSGHESENAVGSV